MSTDLHASERRTEPRVPCSDAVEISFDNPAPVVVRAELVEANSHGFRASYESCEMSAGLEVRYRRGGDSGRARVIWTQVTGDRRVSGFMVL